MTKDKKKSLLSTLSVKFVESLQKMYTPFVTYFVNHRKITLVTTLILAVAGFMTIPFLGKEFTLSFKKGRWLSGRRWLPRFR